MFKVEAGYEPPSFTAHFVAWDNEVSDKWVKGEKKPEAKRMQTKQISSNDVGFLDPATNKFSLKELQGGYPDRIKPNAKEEYLSDEDFRKCFGVDLATFKGWKQWKKNAQKKKFDLF